MASKFLWMEQNAGVPFGNGFVLCWHKAEALRQRGFQFRTTMLQVSDETIKLPDPVGSGRV